MSILGKSLNRLIREQSSSDVTSFFHDRIKAHNDTLNALIHEVEISADTNEKDSIDSALKGIPGVLKDNVLTSSMPTTASSKLLDGFLSPYDATVTKRLIDSGATFLGKANMDAWAHGSSTETSDYGPTLNPYNTDYVAGGSSGGSAAAVAAGLAPYAIGTETAGSIRGPAAWCGIVGLKPTYGRVSRHGIIAMGSSWDCPGPMTQTVEDAALLLGIIAGHDKYDATSIEESVPDYIRAMKEDKKYTIGIAKEYFENVDEEIMESVNISIEELKKLGHTIKEVSLLSPKYAISVYMILQRSEVSSNLGRYDGIRYANPRSFFGNEAERRIMLGTYALSTGYYDAYYKKAQKVRYLIREDFEKAFEEVDVIFAPTMPVTATKVGDIDNFSFYGEMMDILSEPAAAAGIPAITIPSAVHSNGLPIGVQFMGPHLKEGRLLNIAYQLEKALDFDRVKVMEKYT